MVIAAFIGALWQFYLLQIIGRALTMGILATELGVVVPKWFIAKRGRAVAPGGLGQRIGNAVNSGVTMTNGYTMPSVWL